MRLILSNLKSMIIYDIEPLLMNSLTQKYCAHLLKLSGTWGYVLLINAIMLCLSHPYHSAVHGEQCTSDQCQEH